MKAGEPSRNVIENQTSAGVLSDCHFEEINNYYFFPSAGFSDVCYTWKTKEENCSNRMDCSEKQHQQRSVDGDHCAGRTR